MRALANATRAGACDRDSELRMLVLLQIYGHQAETRQQCTGVQSAYTQCSVVRYHGTRTSSSTLCIAVLMYYMYSCTKFSRYDTAVVPGTYCRRPYPGIVDTAHVSPTVLMNKFF